MRFCLVFVAVCACGRIGFDPEDAGDGSPGGARLELLAGVPGTCGLVDGPGVQAQFQQPQGLAIDHQGHVYVGERFNYCVRVVGLATGEVSRFAGRCGHVGPEADGPDGTANFSEVGGLALDEAAGRMFVSDYNGHTIRVIAMADRSVSTVAGQAGMPGYAEGAGSGAAFDFPSNLDLDTNGDVYVADAVNHRIRKITGNTTSLVAGGGAVPGDTDDPLMASINEPVGMTVDADYVTWSEPFSLLVRRMDRRTLQVRSVAGGGTEGFVDGTGTAARLAHPVGVLSDRAGTLYIADRDNGAIRRVDEATLAVTTLVGDPAAPGTLRLGPLPGSLISPYTLALAPTGELVIADREQCALFVIRP